MNNQEWEFGYYLPNNLAYSKKHDDTILVFEIVTM